MNKIAFFFLCCMMMSLSSCFVALGGGNHHAQKACERHQTGEICFENTTKKNIKVYIGDTKTILEPYSAKCLDMYEGDYEYKAKQGLKRWEEYISVLRCEQNHVCFRR